MIEVGLIALIEVAEYGAHQKGSEEQQHQERDSKGNSYRLSWDDKYEELCKEQNIEKYNHVLFGKNMPEIK